MPRQVDIAYVFGWVNLELYERDYRAALDRLADLSEEAVPAGDAGRKELRQGGLHRLGVDLILINMPRGRPYGVGAGRAGLPVPIGR